MASPNTARFVVDRLLRDKSDLLARKLIRDKLDLSKGWHRKDLYSHYGCVNAIEFSSEGKLLVSGGDDRRVLLWRVDDIIDDRPKYMNPEVMRAEHSSNIFCLALGSDSSKIFSAGNDETVIVHDLHTGGPLHYFLHEKPVYCISLEPGNDNVFCSACDDGRVLIFDIRREPAENEAVVLASSTGAFHGVMYNPTEPRLVATANAKQGLRLYDVRKPKEHVICYGGNQNESCMSVRFNQKGTHLLGLRRRREALIYPTHSDKVCVEFDNPGYYNSCTMKSCCFAGPKDEYVLSGSDDFNLYMWKVPNLNDVEGTTVKRAHHVLSGHRSIVNQVRYNSAYNMIASSGVEKIIKLWSPMRFPGNCDDPKFTKKKRPRKMFTHEEYITLVLQSGQFMSHDYSQHNTEEDPRMMAFFDSLVQREVEGWSTDEDGDKVSTDCESTASSSDNDYDTYFMGFRRRVRRRLNQGAPEVEEVDQNGEGNEEADVDETNNRIAQLIAKKRKKLLRSRNQLTNKKPPAPAPKTKPDAPAAPAVPAPTVVNNGHANSEAGPSNAEGSSTSVSGAATNGTTNCNCTVGRLKRLARTSDKDSSDEDREQPSKKKVLTQKDSPDSPSDSQSDKASSSSEEDVFSRMRRVCQQDSGVDLNGSSSSSTQNQPGSGENKFRKSDRKPNKREYRRRKKSSSEESSLKDLDCFLPEQINAILFLTVIVVYGSAGFISFLAKD